jgi:hypothetical protein
MAALQVLSPAQASVLSSLYLESNTHRDSDERFAVATEKFAKVLQERSRIVPMNRAIQAIPAPSHAEAIRVHLQAKQSKAACSLKEPFEEQVGQGGYGTSGIRNLFSHEAWAVDWHYYCDMVGLAEIDCAKWESEHTLAMAEGRLVMHDAGALSGDATRAELVFHATSARTRAATCAAKHQQFFPPAVAVVAAAAAVAGGGGCCGCSCGGGGQ